MMGHTSDHGLAPPIRDAVRSDVPSILEIHNDVVRNTTSIYDRHQSTLEEREAWFDARMERGFPVLVLESEGVVAGFSSFAEWRPRWGYRFTVEHSVHVRADCRNRGIGRALMEALFVRAIERDVHAMVGHIDSAAVASVHLHRKLGFETIGTFREVGRMTGGWLDIIAMQKNFPNGTSDHD